MKTKSKRKRMEFQDLGKRKVVGHFDGGTIGSDGGSLLLREINRRLEIDAIFTVCQKILGIFLLNFTKSFYP